MYEVNHKTLIKDKENLNKCSFLYLYIYEKGGAMLQSFQFLTELINSIYLNKTLIVFHGIGYPDSKTHVEVQRTKTS